MRLFPIALTAAVAGWVGCGSSTPTPTDAGMGTAPTVVSMSPASGATNVAVASVLTVTFSEAMDCSTIVGATFGESEGGVSISGTVACSGAQATFTPTLSLSGGTTYVAAVQAGVKSASGLSLAQTVSWSFTTAVVTMACTGDLGKIYVADFGNNRVVRADDMCGDNWTSLGGALGAGVGEFDGAEDVFVDATGEIYIADTFNNRIVRMDDMTGTGWTSLGTPTGGTGTNQFDTPHAIFVAGGHIYVTDGFSSPRIVQMDDMTGANWTVFPPTSAASTFKELWGLFVDGTGRIYVTDNDRGSTQTVARLVRMDDISGGGFVSFGTVGSSTDEFMGPWGVSVDTSGRIYVADEGNQRIVRIDDMTGTGWTTLGTLGYMPGQFFAPTGIFVDATDRIYVSDFGGSIDSGGDNRIDRMDDMSGTNWTTLGTLGAGVKNFNAPTSVWLH
jgi:sugar lactone lactonase YvrE